MLAKLLVLSLAMIPVALLYARFEYRRRGGLSLVGLTLLCAMFFVPNLLLEYATKYEWPETALDYAVAVIAAAGVILCVVAIGVFRSPLKVLCLDTGALAVSGPYRWSRNPQYVGWFLFLLGFALNDWSWWSLAVMIIVATYLHLLILVEEEHLTRIFGQKYVEYCQSVPRYFGRPLSGR